MAPQIPIPVAPVSDTLVPGTPIAAPTAVPEEHPWEDGYGPSRPSSPKAARTPVTRKRLAGSIVIGAASILLVSAVANAASGDHGGLASVTSEDRPLTVAQTPTATPTPRPTRAPVTTQKTVDVTEAIPFGASEIDDPNSDAGTSVVTVVGVDGVKTKSYTVTYVDGKETSRALAAEAITTAPVNQVTAVGSYVAPVAQAPVAAAPQQSGGCDSNYSGCVPIASDVDCLGGSGNGPAYAEGPITVIGIDIYGLDSNDDGQACEA